jgi:2-oxoglutarate ferredoxin oxidoreductase subunit beta
MKFLKDSFIDIKAYDRLDEEKCKDKFLMGEFKDISAPEYTEEYQKIINSLGGNENE